MPTRRSYIDIKSDGRTRLTNATPITEFGETSIAGAFLDMIATESDQIYSEIEYVHRAIDPTRNYGKELDNLGYMLGITRDAGYIAIDDSVTNVYFYIDKRTNMSPGSLINNLYKNNIPMKEKLVQQGYINNASVPSEIIIPANTTIYNNDKSISYITLSETRISNSNPQAYVGVVASREGSYANVQSNTLVKHELGNIFVLKDLAKYIFVTNTFPIQTGSDSMGDREYRYKISTQPQSINANELTIRQAILSIPGVRNAYFERGKYGYGTYSVLIEGTSPLVSEGLLNIVKQKINSLDGNDAAFVYAPEYRGIELSLEIIIEIGYNTDVVIENVRTNIINYVNNIPVGGTLVWNTISAIIMSVTGVKDYITNYYKIGEYNAFKKLNTKQVVLRTINQRTHSTEKLYTDKGLIKLCSREGNV